MSGRIHQSQCLIESQLESRPLKGLKNCFLLQYPDCIR